MGTTPTIWCTIQRVRPSPPWRRAGVAVTVADREGTAVTMALMASDLDTYASFQAAVLRATGHPFHYLPVTAPWRPPVTESRWLAQMAERRPGAMLRKLASVPLIVKGMVKRALVGTSVVSAE
jgi:hypothetical protein